MNAHIGEGREKARLNDNFVQYEAALKNIQEVEKHIEELKAKKQEEILELQRTYENKVWVMLV